MLILNCMFISLCIWFKIEPEIKIINPYNIQEINLGDGFDFFG